MSVIWLLRLFPAFQAMELRCAEQRLMLESMAEAVRGAKADVELFRSEMAASHRSEVEATRKVADFAAMMRFGRSIFDVPSEIPVKPEDMKPITNGKPQASDLVLEAERQFLAELARDGVLN